MNTNDIPDGALVLGGQIWPPVPRTSNAWHRGDDKIVIEDNSWYASRFADESEPSAGPLEALASLRRIAGLE
jgi:hypothetical protein